MIYVTGFGLTLIALLLVGILLAGDLPVRHRNTRVLGGFSAILGMAAILIGILFPQGLLQYASVALLSLGSVAFLVTEERLQRRMDRSE